MRPVRLFRHDRQVGGYRCHSSAMAKRLRSIESTIAHDSMWAP